MLIRMILMCFVLGLAVSCKVEPPVEPLVPEPVEARPRSVPIPEKPDVDRFKIPAQLQSTESGLQYYMEKGGVGVQPKLGQIVTLHFTGWLTDGRVLDSSKTRKPPKPISFPLGEGDEVAGWTEGIGMMQVGAAYWFVIPPELAYGEADLGMIKPGSTLVYRMELYEVR